MKSPTITPAEKSQADREIRRTLLYDIQVCRARAKTGPLFAFTKAQWRYMADRYAALRRTVRP